jgi:hypothetical protein
MGLGEGIPRLSPGGYPTKEGLGVLVASVQKLPCRTGRGMLVASGAIKDDLLFLGQTVEPGLKLLESKRPLQLHAAASGLIGIGAHQESLARFNPGIDLLRGDAFGGGHDAPPLFQIVV